MSSTKRAHDRGRTGSEETKPTRGRTKPGQAGSILATSRKPGRWRARRPPAHGLIVVAALLVLGFGIATTYLVTRAGDRVSVLAVGAPIAKGQTIQRSDLVSQAVSGVPGALEVAEVDVVVGKSATVDLLAGQVLTGDMVTSATTPAGGQATVGLALDPTRVPSAGLAPGDVVDVVAVPAGQDANASGRSLDKPTVLAAEASVFAVQGTAADAGQVLLTLVVEQKESRPVAAYSTSGRVAVVEVAPDPAASEVVAAGEGG